MGGILVGLILGTLFKYLYEKWKSKQNYEEESIQIDITEKPMENNKGTRELFLETLTKIGCQYQLAEEEDDNRIFFAYQGEHFFVNATNKANCIQIYDTHWEQVDLYDVDTFSRLRKAINESNLNNSVTAVYTIDEERNCVYVHCKSIILFIPQIPDIEEYLNWSLYEFFRVHQFVNNEMTRLRDKEK